MPSFSMKYKESWFMTLGAGTIVAAINLKCSKAVVIIASKISCSHRWCMAENEKIFPQKDIINYPDGCIICWKSFSVGCMSAVKKATWTVKVNGDKNNKEIIECMVYWLLFSSFFDLTWSLNLCSFAVHHIASFQDAAGTSPSIQVSSIIVFKHQSLFHWT